MRGVHMKAMCELVCKRLVMAKHLRMDKSA